MGWMDCPPVSPGGGSEVPEALLEPGVGAGLTALSEGKMEVFMSLYHNGFQVTQARRLSQALSSLIYMKDTHCEHTFCALSLFFSFE